MRSLVSFLRWLRRARTAESPRRQGSSPFRPALDELETRLTPSVSLGGTPDYAVPGPQAVQVNSDVTEPVRSTESPVLNLGGAFDATPASPDCFFDLDGAFDGGGLTGATADALTAAHAAPTPVATTASLSGRVTDQHGLGVEGVSLTLTGTDARGNAFRAAVTTNESGQHTFTGIPPGPDYTLTETPPDDFSPTGATAGAVNGETRGCVLDGTASPAIGQIALDAGDIGTSYNFTGFADADAGE